MNTITSFFFIVQDKGFSGVGGGYGFEVEFGDEGDYDVEGFVSWNGMENGDKKMGIK